MFMTSLLGRIGSCLFLLSGLLGAAEISTPAGPAGLNNTFGVIVGLDGDIYFCDTGNHQVKKIGRRDRKVTVVAGTGVKGYSGDGGNPLQAELFEPYEVRFHAGGDLYWVEMKNNIVRKLDARTNTVSTVAGTGEAGFSGDGGPAVEAKLSQPHSIQFDHSGNLLLICDIKNHRIRSVDLAAGKIDTWCGSGEAKPTPEGAKAGPEVPLKGPRALDIDPAGNLWLALREGNALYRIDRDTLTLHRVAGSGKNGYHAEAVPALEANLSGPKGVAVSPDGKWIYLADTESHSVRVVDWSVSPPMLRPFAGDGQKGDGPGQGDPLKCRMARPHGVGTDPQTGDLYIGDSETNTIRKVTGCPGAKPWKALSQYATETFELKGVTCRVTRPDRAAAGNPWIWRTRFFGAFPGMDETLLARGWHVAATDLTDLFGSPEEMTRFDAVYQEFRSRHQLAEKPVMEGFSRGGLSATNWAIAHPDKVLALYLDAAVMDIHSWPKKQSPDLWKKALTVYGLDESTAGQWKGPLTRLETLVQHQIPVFIVAGGNDTVVPYGENTGLLESKYRALGGKVEAIVKASCGHHPHGLHGPLNDPIADKLEALFSGK